MYVVHLGFSGFPVGNAAVQRVRSTFKAIQGAGYTPLIVNKQSIYKKVSYTQKVNRFDGLIFIDTSPDSCRPASFFKRNINKLQGLLGELRLLFKKRKKIQYAVVYTSLFYELLYYRLLSKIFGFKIALQYVEYMSAVENRDDFFLRLNDRLFDRYCQHFCDGVIPISEFLKNKVLEHRPGVPVLKIPAICDFQDFERIPAAAPGFTYLMYCGTINYIAVINFVLSFFEKVKDQQGYQGKIVLIIGGANPQGFVEIKETFSKSKYRDDIVFYSNIPYDQVIGLYKSADLLIIPMRNTIQDIARFPHKISEYTASGRPFISTNIGEVKHYFVNKRSALLTADYEVDQYVNALKEMQAENINFDEIGKKANEIGYQHFYYQAYVDQIKTFFEKL